MLYDFDYASNAVIPPINPYSSYLVNDSAFDNLGENDIPLFPIEWLRLERNSYVIHEEYQATNALNLVEKNTRDSAFMTPNPYMAITEQHVPGAGSSPLTIFGAGPIKLEGAGWPGYVIDTEAGMIGAAAINLQNVSSLVFKMRTNYPLNLTIVTEYLGALGA